MKYNVIRSDDSSHVFTNSIEADNYEIDCAGNITFYKYDWVIEEGTIRRNLFSIAKYAWAGVEIIEDKTNSAK